MRTIKWKERMLTLTELKRLGACGESIDAFRWRFHGRAASLAAVVKELHANPANPASIYADYRYERWEAWLLAQDAELTSELVGAGAEVLVYFGHALEFAADKGRLRVVERLISLGASINAGGGSVLRAAASRGYLNVVRCLVQHGANITATAAIEHARARGHKDVVAYLQSVEEGRNRADEERIAALASR